jgi:glutathione S-transferase
MSDTAKQRSTEMQAGDGVERYRLFGSELSPYSVKVRAYLRYKALPHTWIVRNETTQAEFARRARLPLMPLLLTPEGEAMQDSTPILERLEARHPDPPMGTDDALLAFMSALIEEWADEWGNKWMFHLRWARDVDQWSAAGRIAHAMRPEATHAEVQATAAQVRARMLSRLGYVGSNEANAPLIEQSFHDTLERLESHLSSRPYLLGGRPALADFGLWGQLYTAWTDPTAGARIEARAQRVLDWIHRMMWPRALGELEPFATLEPTLLPLLRDQIAALFLPWSLANEAALSEGRDTFEVKLPGGTWTQQPQRYHARSLAALRTRYTMARHPALDALLERAACLAALTAAPTVGAGG